jgi:protein O-mannosyl-transferase
MVSARPAHSARGFALSSLAVALACLVTGAPSLGGGFLDWDDDRMVTGNPDVAALTPANVAHAFAGLRFESYQPLHLVSYMVDGSLWPGRAPLYRAHNLALYMASAVLLLALLVRLGIPLAAATLGSLLFAVTPCHVESVAWISARKDVLALCLSLAAWHAHLSARGTPRRRAGLTIAGVVLLAAALLAKSAALVAPFMMLAADVGLRRLAWRRAALGLVPYLVPALAAAALLPLLWSASSLVREPPVPGFLGRAGLVGWTLAHYLATAASPFALSPLYAPPDATGLARGAALGFVAVAVTVALLVQVERRRGGAGPWAVAAAWFTLGLAPFLNVVPLYYVVADRYLLFPSLGVALAGALAARSILALARPDRRALALAGFLAVAVAWGAAAVSESRAWRDSRSLWEHAVARQPGAFFARLKLGETCRESGDLDCAAGAYRAAWRIEPGSRLAVTGLYWSQLLADGRGLGLDAARTERMTLEFAGHLDDLPSLAVLAYRLERQGLRRAAGVVRERLAVYSGSAPGKGARP